MEKNEHVSHFAIFYLISKNQAKRDFPGGPVVKNLPANAGDSGSTPELGRFLMQQGNQSHNYWSLGLLKTHGLQQEKPMPHD